jgi:hypothetical protein
MKPIYEAIGIIVLVCLLGCNLEPPQNAPAAPPAPPKPKASSYVVEMVKAADRASGEGKDHTLLRFFLANRVSLTPQDIDYIAEHTYDTEIRGFITAEYYSKPMTVSNQPPIQLEDPK